MCPIVACQPPLLTQPDKMFVFIFINSFIQVIMPMVVRLIVFLIITITIFPWILYSIFSLVQLNVMSAQPNRPPSPSFSLSPFTSSNSPFVMSAQWMRHSSLASDPFPSTSFYSSFSSGFKWYQHNWLTFLFADRKGRRMVCGQGVDLDTKQATCQMIDIHSLFLKVGRGRQNTVAKFHAA